MGNAECPARLQNAFCIVQNAHGEELTLFFIKVGVFCFVFGTTVDVLLGRAVGIQITLGTRMSLAAATTLSMFRDCTPSFGKQICAQS